MTTTITALMGEPDERHAAARNAAGRNAAGRNAAGRSAAGRNGRAAPESGGQGPIRRDEPTTVERGGPGHIGPGAPTEAAQVGPLAAEPTTARPTAALIRSAGRRARLVQQVRAGPDTGMATAEYAIATVAAAGFAGLLLIILRSDEIRGLLLGIIRGALAL